jgi:hypothetical protein
VDGRILDPSQADKAGLFRMLYALSPHKLRSTTTLRPISWTEVESGEHSQVEADSWGRHVVACCDRRSLHGIIACVVVD